jgi:dienelactone hydrolase
MLSFILVLAALQQEAPAPVFRDTVVPLPSPTGPHQVGTSTAYLVDNTRRDSEFPEGRPITLQLWYPAPAGGSATAPYLEETGFDAMLLRIQYYTIDSMALSAWASVKTHARRDAPPSNGHFPLVTFSVGLGLARANYTSIAEEMASHGYIVALVESPLAGTMMLPSGREVMDTNGLYQTATAHRAGVASWSADVRYTLDRLERRELPSPSARVAETIDWQRVGAAGHSSGGLVAITTCEEDRRVRACVDLDGGMASPEQEPMAEFVPRGVTKSTLLLRSRPVYTDADFARRGITREQWEKRGEGGRIALDLLTKRSHGMLWIGGVEGTGHMSFSDAPFVMASAITRFGGKIIEPRRGLLVITTAMRAFFDQEFGTNPGALEEASRRFPELSIAQSH